MEDRLTPAGFFLTGVGGLTNPPEPNVRLYDASSASGGSTTFRTPPGDLAAFPGGFAGSVRVAGGDINHDGFDDIITAQGPGTGSGSQIRIFDGRSALVAGTRVEIASFFAYSNAPGVSQTPGFGGGVFVASADFNNDGWDELVVSAGAGARGHVKVFNFHGAGDAFLGSVPELRSSFFAYTDFAGEIRTTTMRVGGNTLLVTASGAGTTASDVRTFNNAYNIGQVPDLTLVPAAQQFFPFAGYTGGLSVAAGDVDGGNEELFVSKNGGTSTVFVFAASDYTAPTYQFEAFPGFTGEVRLGAANVDGEGQVEVLTSTGSSPGAEGAHVKAWHLGGATPTELRSFFAYPGYINGVWLNTNDFTTTQTFTNTTALNIPDTITFVDSTVSVDPFTSFDGRLRARAVQTDITLTALTGSSNQDLDVFLAAPFSGSRPLFEDVNGDGGGFAVTLADAAVTNIALPTGKRGVRLTGTFTPQSINLNLEFARAPLNGNWTLSLRDDKAGDTYRLDSWAVRLVY